LRVVVQEEDRLVLRHVLEVAAEAVRFVRTYL
jgi:hypothetical protein